MNNKTVVTIVVALLVIIGGLYFYYRTPNTSYTAPATTNTEEETSSANGRVVFSVTDAAADMSTISEINLKVSKVDVHSAAEGWVTVSTTPKTYSLLALDAKGESELLADVQLKDGTYDQVRLTVDSISVQPKTGASKPAKLPSGELKLNSSVVVNEGETTSVNFDFLADKSLHMTGNGSYIFAPVVKTESKSSANVSVDSASKVTISGGKVDNTNTSGMDIDGSVKANFELKTNAKLNIGSDNMIKLEL